VLGRTGMRAASDGRVNRVTAIATDSSPADSTGGASVWSLDRSALCPIDGEEGQTRAGHANAGGSAGGRRDLLLGVVHSMDRSDVWQLRQWTGAE
jgi:hypothetical protein